MCRSEVKYSFVPPRRPPVSGRVSVIRDVQQVLHTPDEHESLYDAVEQDKQEDGDAGTV
jgi:hypothetical protein